MVFVAGTVKSIYNNIAEIAENYSPKSLPVITTGLAEAGNINPEDYILLKHRYLGIAVGVWGSLYAGLRISAMCWDLPLEAKHYAFLSMLMLALIWWTCDYGWLISRFPQPINPPQSPQST
jgi:hypothetical protein